MLNKAVLMGRLTRDPEIRRTPSGVAVANFTLAVDRNFARQGEEKQTDFINIVAFSKTAEFAERYFLKGQLVAVAGRIQTRSWEDQSGGKRYATEVVAEECHFAEPKREPQSNGQQGGYSQPAYGAQPQGGYRQTGAQRTAQQGQGLGDWTDYEDEDLPF